MNQTNVNYLKDHISTNKDVNMIKKDKQSDKT